MSQPSRIRSAEKERISTCMLADRIARISIDKCREVFPEVCSGQTVVASIILQDSRDLLEVVSLGIGTKFMQLGNISGSSFEKIKDCHAEILARRAFNRFVIDEIKSASGVWFERVDGSFKIRDGVRIHFYVSSQPCGNACIRKWAKSKKEVFNETLADRQIPSDVHERMLGHAIKEGQFSLTFKKDSTFSLQPDASTSSEAVLPDGITWFKSGAGSILSCSDKIALWNAYGLLKVPVSTVCDRLDMSSITIGRKFVREHTRRAICCRLKDAHHPVIMCSALKLDESTFASDEEAAVFGKTCGMWTSRRGVEQLEPKTGLKVNGEVSAFSTARMTLDVADLGLTDSNLSEYAAIKKAHARAYLEAVSV